MAPKEAPNPPEGFVWAPFGNLSSSNSPYSAVFSLPGHRQIHMNQSQVEMILKAARQPIPLTR
jgi:hypothetical protein